MAFCHSSSCLPGEADRCAAQSISDIAFSVGDWPPVSWAMAAKVFWSSSLADSSVMPSGPVRGVEGVWGSRMGYVKSMKF